MTITAVAPLHVLSASVRACLRRRGKFAAVVERGHIVWGNWLRAGDSITQVVDERTPINLVRELDAALDKSAIFLVCSEFHPAAWFDGKWHVTSHELPTIPAEAYRSEIAEIVAPRPC